MTDVAERSRMTPDEYLVWERAQPTRHEFYFGEIFAMAGGSMRHNALCASLIEALRVQLKGRCVVFTADQRVVGLQRDRYVYPDVSVVCGPVATEAGTTDVLANPTIVIEVLSATTARYDRDLKWQGYQSIASLTDYVLVSQDVPRLEHFRRGAAGTWTYRSAAAGEQVVLTSEAVLDIDAIFAGALALPGD